MARDTHRKNLTPERGELQVEPAAGLSGEGGG
jgi:hypothetical protein